MPSAAAMKKAAYAKRVGELLDNYDTAFSVSYTHLTLPTKASV